MGHQAKLKEAEEYQQHLEAEMAEAQEGRAAVVEEGQTLQIQVPPEASKVRI